MKGKWKKLPPASHLNKSKRRSRLFRLAKRLREEGHVNHSLRLVTKVRGQ